MSLKIKEKTVKLSEVEEYKKFIEENCEISEYVSLIKRYDYLYWNKNLSKILEMALLVDLNKLQAKLKKICRTLEITSADLMITCKNGFDNLTQLAELNNDKKELCTKFDDTVYLKFLAMLFMYVNELVFGYDVGFIGENIPDFIKIIKSNYLTKIPKNTAKRINKEQIKKDNPKMLEYFESNRLSVKLGCSTATISNMLINGVIIKHLLPKLLGDKFSFYASHIKFENSLIGNVIFNVDSDEFFQSPTKQILDLLRKRGVILPKEGLSVWNNNDLFNAQDWCSGKIDIFEEVYKENDFLIMINVSENFQVSIINLTQGAVYSQDLNIYYNLNLLYKLYDLDKVAEPLLKYNYPMAISFKHLEDLNENMMIIAGVNNNIDVEVKTPYYWKYRGGLRNNTQLYREKYCFLGKKIHVNTYVRELPEGYKRSVEATKLAKLYCLDLKDNETVVSGFERQYRKTEKMNLFDD